jgi:hypothetical protein
MELRKQLASWLKRDELPAAAQATEVGARDVVHSRTSTERHGGLQLVAEKLQCQFYPFVPFVLEDISLSQSSKTQTHSQPPNGRTSDPAEVRTNGEGFETCTLIRPATASTMAGSASKDETAPSS